MTQFRIHSSLFALSLLCLNCSSTGDDAGGAGGSSATGGDASGGTESATGGADQGSGGEAAGGTVSGVGGSSGGSDSGSGGSSQGGELEAGAACTGDSKCAQQGASPGACKLDWPGGYCTGSCVNDGGCSQGASCRMEDGTAAEPGEVPTCLDDCFDNVCRDGYACTFGVCIPE